MLHGKVPKFAAPPTKPKAAEANRLGNVIDRLGKAIEFLGTVQLDLSVELDAGLIGERGTPIGDKIANVAQICLNSLDFSADVFAGPVEFGLDFVDSTSVKLKDAQFGGHIITAEFPTIASHDPTSIPHLR